MSIRAVQIASDIEQKSRRTDPSASMPVSAALTIYRNNEETRPRATNCSCCFTADTLRHDVRAVKQLCLHSDKRMSLNSLKDVAESNHQHQRQLPLMHASILHGLLRIWKATKYQKSSAMNKRLPPFRPAGELS
jgi:hypothetical protein